MCLSVPVPAKGTRLIELCFFPIAGTPIKYGVRPPKSGNIVTLKNLLAEQISVNAANLAFYELYGNRAFELPDAKRLFDVRQSDSIFVYVSELFV